jgi:two-component system phosphate regulon sensor histidine kinase PhoR
MKQWPHSRAVVAAALGAAFEAGVSLGFGPGGLEGAVLAASLGVLIAVLAGALGGLWAGLVVAAAGWALNFFLVSEQSWRDIVALPAWVGAAAAAGWVSDRLRARSTSYDILEEKFGALRLATGDAVIALDGDGRITSWSDGAERTYGYTSDDVDGVDFAKLVATAEGSEPTRAILAAVKRGDVVADIVVSHERNDASVRTIRLSATPVREESRAVGGAIIVATDITDLDLSRQQTAELEARYQSLAQQLPGATYVHAVESRDHFVYVSPQVGTMLGYRAEDWLTDRGLFFRLVHEDDRARIQSELEGALQAGTPFVNEYRMLSRDGNVVWIRDEATTLRGHDGEPRYVQGYLHDISAEQEARLERERLRSSERAAVSNARDRQLKLDLLAKASLALTGSAEPEVGLRRAAELLAEGFAAWCVIDLVDDKGITARAVAARGDADPVTGAPLSEPEPAAIEVIETGEATLSEARICVPITARGRIVGAITLVAARNGRPYGPDDLTFAEHLALLAGFVVDNARLHQQVQEGADAAHVLTYVADGVFLVDRGGAIRLWNPTMEAITGFGAQTVVGAQAAEVIPEWQTLSDRIPVGGAEPVAPETVPLETEYGERWVSVSGVEFFDGTVYALRDLTETRRLEQLKAEFVATASHELRTPLAAVYGAAQTLRRHDFALDESGRERFVSLIVDESERLGRIVNDILLANQLDVGNLELRSEPFDPSDLVERVVEAARAHAPTTITIEIAAGPQPPSVASDRDRVRQVLVNLVENAIKYSPEGGRVEVGAVPAERMVRFFVRDEGLGIPEEEQRRIFDKFYRLDPHMTAGIGGTGLGLYICNELVRRMGGRIWVESNGERGSTFSFVIPTGEASSGRPRLQEVFDSSGG